MKNSISFFLLILYVVLFSCQQNILTEEKKVEHLSTFNGEKIRVHLDTLTSPSLAYVDYGEEDQTLRLFNYMENAIQVYDVKSGEMIRKVKFPKEGPESIQEVYGFRFLNDNSIFIFCETKSISIANMKGKVYHQFRAEEGRGFRPAAFSGCMAEWVDNKLYFSNFGYPSYLTQKNPYSRVKQSLERAYDPRTGKMTSLEVDHPAYLKKEGERVIMTDFSRCFDGEKFVYAWFKVPELYIMHKDSTRIHQQVELKSQYVEKQFNSYFKGDFTNSQEVGTFLADQSEYSHIVYDPYMTPIANATTDWLYCE